MVEKVLRGIVLTVIIILFMASGFQASKIALSEQNGQGWAPVEQAMGKQGASRGMSSSSACRAAT